MRYAALSLLILALTLAAAQAQSVMDNLPPVVIEGESPPGAPVVRELPAYPPVSPSSPSESFTVSDVQADVTADTAAHARDQALMQAQRTAYAELSARLGIADNGSKLSDDAIASLVHSFEVQSERVSAVRYIGVYTIHFKPSAIQRKLGFAGAGQNGLPALYGPVAHVTVSVQTDSLAALAQTKQRLGKVPQVAKIDTVALGRGMSQIDVSYRGSFDELTQGLASQGLVLVHDGSGNLLLMDSSMAPL